MVFKPIVGAPGGIEGHFSTHMGIGASINATVIVMTSSQSFGPAWAHAVHPQAHHLPKSPEQRCVALVHKGSARPRGGIEGASSARA
jgi:hypothetical protein